MKTIMLFIVLSVTFTIQSCAEKSNTKKVPEQVLETFKNKFPDAKKVDWEMENDSVWEAEFKMDGKSYSANFTISGTWLETEYEIKISEIPTNILSILNQNFTDYKVEEAEMAESPAGKSYEFKIEVGKNEFEVAIDSQGKLTKKDADAADDED